MYPADGIKKVLEKGYSEFKDKLEKIEKKIELDVVAVWNNLDSIIKRNGDENEEIRKFKEEIAKKSPQDTFQERIEIGSMIKDALDKEKDDLQSEMLEFLKDKVKVSGFKKHELMDDRMILNCAFLLDKDKEKEFDRALKELNEKYNEKINFRCISSLPLYSFFTYEVKKVNFENINNARKLLGLGEEVDPSEIKASYHRLVREKHPDKFPDDMDAQRKFEEIQRAYKMLIDYCQDERKSLKKKDVEYSYMINIFDTGYLQ
jgi:DnaJ-domain-containing protein 1